MATNTSDFYTYSKSAGTSKNLQKPLDGGDNNVWGTYINTDLDTIVSAINATSDLIADANENELIDFTATGSAVNHIGITNSATGNPPQITAAGDDTNIDLTLAAKGSGDVNITPGSTGDVNIPANKGVTFASDGDEKIESDDTDLTVNSGGDINLTATSDINVPQDVGVTFGNDGEKIEGNGTKLDIAAAEIDFSIEGSGDINIPADVGLTFAADNNEKIESDDTDLTVNSGGAINLTATTDVVIPADVGVTFGTGEKIEGNDTDLTLTSGGDIDLNATADVNIPSGVGLSFAADNNDKIESNDTDLTVNSGGDINLTATSDVNLPAQVGLTFGADTEKIEADGSNNMTHTAAGNITLDASGDITLSADGDNINFDDGTTSRFEIGLSTGDVTMTDNDNGAGLGPELKLSREGGSQVADDVIGGVTFAGQDDGTNATNYSRIQTVVKTVTNTSEDGKLEFWTMDAGTLTKQLVIDSDGTFLLPSGTLTIGST